MSASGGGLAQVFTAVGFGVYVFLAGAVRGGRVVAVVQGTPVKYREIYVDARAVRESLDKRPHRDASFGEAIKLARGMERQKLAERIAALCGATPPDRCEVRVVDERFR